jgi:hypothetical protein
MQGSSSVMVSWLSFSFSPNNFLQMHCKCKTLHFHVNLQNHIFTLAIVFVTSHDYGSAMSVAGIKRKYYHNRNLLSDLDS